MAAASLIAMRIAIATEESKTQGLYRKEMGRRWFRAWRMQATKGSWGKDQTATRGEAKSKERLARAGEQGVRAVWCSLWTPRHLGLSSSGVGPTTSSTVYQYSHL